jgi:hypothetical protein
MPEWIEQPTTYADALYNLTDANFHTERSLIEAEVERLKGDLYDLNEQYQELRVALQSVVNVGDRAAVQVAEAALAGKGRCP